jgi:hypothetical protein
LADCEVQLIAWLPIAGRPRINGRTPGIIIFATCKVMPDPATVSCSTES